MVDLTKVYGTGGAQVHALAGVTLDIADGEFTAVMGPSGSGKSTLMHCCAALDTPTSGEVWLGDTELGGLNDKHLTLLRRERIGFVFQKANLIPFLSSIDNVMVALDINRKPTAEEAAAHPEVQAIIKPRIVKLKEITDDFISALIHSLDLVPYGIRWICRQVWVIFEIRITF